MAPLESTGTDGPTHERPLLEVSDLAVSFASRGGGRIEAVNGVSLTVHRRQTLAVVGESGSGKSVTALSVLGLLPRSVARVGRGSIRFDGRELLSLDTPAMRAVRGRDIAMIFQEPMTSLNPVFTVGQQIVEAVRLHQLVGRREAVAIAIQAMTDVGIARAGERIRAYPHQFSGGMRQRVMIAMALACRPRLLLADEPTTALDVTVQAQILALLRSLQHERGMGIMLITHDLGLVAENADVVCVMLGGRAVEYANVFDLFESPKHPYTAGLLSCKPALYKRRDRLRTIAQIMSEATGKSEVDGPKPWWPTSSTSASDGTYSLQEVAPGHWMACARMGGDEAATSSPNLLFRREPSIHRSQLESLATDGS
jgi:ABC-type dipeptide/oligopeptide/nickel transport system ATPase component